MQAVILAGGKGTRLRPYTTIFPKPLVPIGDHPIIEVVIRQLARAGFDKVTISTGHLEELIRAYCGTGERWGVRIDYLRETTPLNTAGALGLLEDCEEDLLVMNGDVLTSLDYKGFLTGHVRRRSAATVATYPREVMQDFGIVHANTDGLLVEWAEKPVHTYQVSMGVYAIARRCLTFIDKGESLSMPDFLMRIVRAGSGVFCHREECYWRDIGRVDDYAQAVDDFEAHRDWFL